MIPSDNPSGGAASSLAAAALRCCALSAVLVLASPDTVDRATPAQYRVMKSFSSGKDFALVFSDEFETENRRFDDESEEHWQAMSKPDPDLGAVHFYNSSPDFVSTLGGKLLLRLRARRSSWQEWDPWARKVTTMTRNYTSAMVTSWNRFCFTGGIIEIRVQLPGDAYGGGLWPAAWLLGNLARPTYRETTDYVWPWSYDKCDELSRAAQLISACRAVPNSELRAEAAEDFESTRPHTAPPPKKDKKRRALQLEADEATGLKPYHGRGAPEIDIFEAMASWTPDKPPNMTTTLSVAPGVEHNRPIPGKAPEGDQLWYQNFELPVNSSECNADYYGFRSGGEAKYWADALSARHILGAEHFEGPQLFRVEWEPPGKGLGYIRWYLNDEEIFGIDGHLLDGVTGASIPFEPMQIILNLAMHNFWGQPQPCDHKNCQACFGCLDCKNEDCQCALPPLLKNCQGLPATMEIDYVRVYQDPDNEFHTIGCDPEHYPTKNYIKLNPGIYKDWSPRGRPPISVFIRVVYWLTLIVVVASFGFVLLRFLSRRFCSDYEWVPSNRSPNSNSPRLRFRRSQRPRLRPSGGSHGALQGCLKWFERHHKETKRGPLDSADEEDSPLIDVQYDDPAFRDSPDERGAKYISLADVMYEEKYR